MAAQTRNFWQILRREAPSEAAATPTPTVERPRPAAIQGVEITPDDPFIAHVVDSPGVVAIDRLNLDSPTLRALKEANLRITVPLVSHHEVVGLINMGPRLSEQEYSADDRRLLGNLSTQAGPALRVAQLARQQQAEARARAPRTGTARRAAHPADAPARRSPQAAWLAGGGLLSTRPRRRR
ncbi:MAG: GAF domain-containing protein [Anaerolineae bacterium]